jgi:sugar lactone lactonase YvrE
VTVATVPGRPLGLEFLGPDEVVVCASDAGLLAVALDGGRVRTLADRHDGRPLRAVNNAAVAPDGTVYFSDSAELYTIAEWRTDLIRRTRGGRLLRREPDGTVAELLGGLEFANGVALAADGSYVAVAETATRRVRRVWLTGERQGRDEVLVDGLPGYPDNLSLGSDGLIWIALPSPRTRVLSAVQTLPGPVRALVSRVPERLQPQPRPTVAVVAVDDAGRPVHDLRGRIDGFRMLTGVRETGGRLWCGALAGEHVATLPVPAAQAGASP